MALDLPNPPVFPGHLGPGEPGAEGPNQTSDVWFDGAVLLPVLHADDLAWWVSLLGGACATALDTATEKSSPIPKPS
jgi:hypothetical protein